MPYQIQPLGPPGGDPGSAFQLGAEWRHLAAAPLNYDQAWASTGNFSRGKIMGGPTLGQQVKALDPRQYTILPSPPPIFDPVLAGQRLGPHTKIGTLSIDMVDWLGTAGQATGDFFSPGSQPGVGDQGVIDPGKFLASKHMDLFGSSETSIPARLSDYALAVPTMILSRIAGGPPAGNEPVPGYYRFQMDPNYWRDIEQAQGDDALRVLARSVAARYIDPGRNQQLVDDLFATFKNDKNVALGLSSGNKMQDWRAKANAYYGPQSLIMGPGGSTAIPFIGDWLAEVLAPTKPDDPKIEAHWLSLTPAQRRDYLGTSGWTQLAGEVVGFLPILGGMNAALAIAKVSGGVAGTAFKAYDTILKSSAALMATGFTVATANWAAEAIWPSWSEGLGAEIDRSRPISKSVLAGLVTQIGFFSSGTFGALPAIQVVSRAVGKEIGLAGDLLTQAGIPHPTLGPLELSFYRDIHGGSAVNRELIGTGLDRQGLDNSIKTSILSHALNWVEQNRRAPLVEGAAEGGLTGRASIDNLASFEEKQLAINDELSRGMADGPGVVADLFQTVAESRRPRPINATDTVRAKHSIAERFSRSFMDELRNMAMRRYGPEFIASRRMVGSYTADAMETWSRAKVNELGGDGSKLGTHSDVEWATIVRTLHQYEYHWWNGELAAAVEKEAMNEAAPTVIRSDHVFKNDVEEAIAIVQGSDAAAAQALVANMIRTKAEASDWFASTWKPPAGVERIPENVNPKTFADWLNQIGPSLPSRRLNAKPGADTFSLPVNSLQAKMDAQGTWTLAFKPVDAEGNLISYVRTRDGGIFKSPWVDYPMESIDNLELGNRGLIQGKMDGLFHGFRTVRLTEFQRGLLYRSLSRFDFLPAQIDRFHQEVMGLSRDLHAQPQTVGAMAKLPEFFAGAQTAHQIQTIAEKIFGKGPYRLREGQLSKGTAGVGLDHVDWASELTKAYVQSFKLNLTAGITSHLKDMGGLGALVAWTSDVAYVAWRFGLSPLFKGGELLESFQFNAMRGIIRGDPTTKSLFYNHGGLGNDYSLLSSEQAYDQLLSKLGTGQDFTVSQRLAASHSFHARMLPEDFALQAETASTQAAAEQHMFDGTPLDLPALADTEDGLIRQLHETLANRPMTTPFDEAEALIHAQITQDLRSVGRDDPAFLADEIHNSMEAQRAGSAPDVARLEEEIRAVMARDRGLTTNVDQLSQEITNLVHTPRDPLAEELAAVVGGNGVVPGLETRARAILDKLEAMQRARGDAGPVLQFSELSTARQWEVLNKLVKEGDLKAPEGAGPYTPTLDEVQTAYEQFQRRPGATDNLEDLAGTPEAFGRMLRDRAADGTLRAMGGPPKRGWRKALDTFIHPTDYKQERSLELQIQIMEREFPALLRASGNDGLVKVFEDLGVREDRWARWLLEDRKLLDEWMNAKGGAGAPAAFDNLLNHAGDANRAAFNDLYSSPEWATVSALWSINLKTAADEAFGTHFFMPYRSAFERSINHPVLGIYPASWTIKAAREWAKFLYDNRTFGDLRLGMAPGQAIAQITRAQAQAFAMSNDTTLDEFLQAGPLGSSLFIFNLMMPGDWSSLPFPLSRTLREAIRGSNPAQILSANIQFMGVTRDAIKIQSAYGELHDLIFGKPPPDPKKVLHLWSERNVDVGLPDPGQR